MGENKIHIKEHFVCYRAKYIQQTAAYIQEKHSTEWLYGLRLQPYQEAKTQLMKLCGVGAKVSVLLM